jgi:alpha-D-ribose 1-methylphosphonate 5-phosphate C-P lyase
MEMGGGITGILVTASVSSTNSILQVTITDASTTNATVKIIKTML